MRVGIEELQLATTAPIQLLDITTRVEGLAEQSKVRNGLLTLISNHTTAFVNLNERETELQRDMGDFLEKIAPRGMGYRHDIDPVDNRPNAHAHLLGLFMNASLSIPIVDGRLLLGSWQSILFVELDGPRDVRTISVQTLGDD